jgi:hypothetical protein
MNGKLLIYGLALWIVGTIGIRLDGQSLLRPGSAAATIGLYALSILAMALVARRICKAAGLPRGQWPAGAVSLVLPTLLLDPLSSAFFAVVFPNVTPSAAGLFGGWMLSCCAGALLGATVGLSAKAQDGVRQGAAGPEAATQ